ncbi:MAG: carboxypeptidase-like regulatory domain-containing protein [Candidatus Norongarragalinales archaeon]
MNPLSKFYFSIEDKYYAFCDWLQGKGLKIYDWFVNPIEDRGVPSFPFFILLLAVIIGGIAFVLAGSSFGLPFGNTVAVEVTVLSESNEPVTGARVLLTLEDGKEFSAISKNGVARLEGLPKDATAELSIQHPSGKYEKKVVLTGKKIIAMLEPSTKTFKVVVASLEGDPVPDALVTFSDPETGSLQQYPTNALGEAEITYSNQDAVFRLRVTAEGFESEFKNCIPSQKECLIPLKASVVQEQVKGSIVVHVKDEKGNPVENAFVSLYNADGYSEAITGGYTDPQGTVFFQESVVVGVSIYVNAEHDDFAPYRGAENNDVQAVRGDKNTEFVVSLKKKQNNELPIDYSKLTIQVTDEAGEPLGNAEVKLFLFAKPFKTIDDKNTNEFGIAEFEVSKSQNFYATAFADGFLPKTSRQLRAGESTKMSLVEAVAGNNGELEVKVRNADGQLVAGASVELVSEDGFNLGYPATETDSDGIALLSEVESDKQMKAHAIFGSQSGSSDVFAVQAGETTAIEVTLDRNFARILARAQDYSQSQQTFVENTTITAFYKDQAIASCNTPSNGSYCNLSVYANVPVLLKAEADGYAVTQSEELTLATGQELAKTILMLPSNLAKDVQILNFSLYKMDSTGSGVLDAEHSATELERGGWYKASLVVSFPQAQKTGFYLRVGDKQAIAEEKAFIASFDRPPQEDRAQIDFGNTFNQENTCLQEAQQQSGSERKWVSFSYPSGKVGVKTLSAKIRIRPTAIANEKIDFRYRAFAVKNGLWARVPEDAELGTKENVPAKEHCFAETLSSEYKVTQGFQKCTDKGCITLTLKSDNKTSSRFLSVEFGKQVLLEAKVKAFAPETVENPIARFSTTSNKLEIEKQLHQPALVDGEATVSTIANARAPGNYMPVKAEFADDGGPIAATDAVLEFTGTGQMVLTVTPQVMEANVPPNDPEFQPLRVTLTTAQGRPIENAVLTIIETGETHPFLGFPNGGNTLAGDGQKDSGKNGIYVFKSVFPRTVGTFAVEADAGVEFAKAQSRDVPVVSTNFLNVEPTDVFVSGATACNSGVQLLLTKTIPVEAQVHYQVSGGSNESQCVEVLQPPRSPFTMKKGKAGQNEKTQVRVRPIKNTDCSLAFNSVLEGSGSAGFAETNFVVDCASLGEPSPTPSPGACSKENCTACNEGQCINLQNQGACKAVYENNQFKRCEQRKTQENKTADFCAAQRFDLGSLLASRLGFMSAQRIFNPNRNDRALAASATNRIVRIPRPPFFQIERASPDCEIQNGKLVCTKKVSPLVPSNGIALSLKNALGFNTQIATETKKPQCFSIRKVENIGLAKIGDFARKTISGAFRLPGGQYATLVVLFEPDQPGCAEYSYDQEKGVTLTPAQGRNELTLTIRDASNLGQAVKLDIVLKIEGESSKYAIASAPNFQSLNGIATRVNNAVEPAVIANNLQFESVEVGDAKIPAKDIASVAVGFPAEGYEFKIGTKTQPNIKTIQNNIEKASFDAVGNARTGVDAVSACTGQEFCFIENNKDFEQALKEEISEDLRKITGTMDSVSFTQAFDYDRVMLETAMTSALQDYLAGLIAYEACKKAGEDPIGDLRQRCASNRLSPQELPLNMGDAFASGFLAATCDSEVLNLASYATSGSVGLPGGYLNTLARRLVTQYILPGRAPIQVNHRIFRNLDTLINVPVKIAGEKGGFVVYSFQPSESIGLHQSGGYPDDFFGMQGFGSQCVPGDQSTCPFPNQCQFDPSVGMGRCVPGALYNNPFQFGPGFDAGNPFDYSYSDAQFQTPLNDDAVIVELKGTYGFGTQDYKRTDKSSSGFAASGMPYLKAGNPAELKGDGGSPNLLTMNKYGFADEIDTKDFLSVFSNAQQAQLAEFFKQELSKEALSAQVKEAIKSNALATEKTVKVVLKAGNESSISIKPIAPPAPSPSATPLPSPSPSPLPSPRPTPTPKAYEGFQYVQPKLSPNLVEKKLDEKPSATPEFELTVMFKVDADNPVKLDAQNSLKSVLAALKYLLDEKAPPLTCQLQASESSVSNAEACAVGR